MRSHAGVGGPESGIISGAKMRMGAPHTYKVWLRFVPMTKLVFWCIFDEAGTLHVLIKKNLHYICINETADELC